jgi:hypothetical protein
MVWYPQAQILIIVLICPYLWKNHHWIQTVMAKDKWGWEQHMCKRQNTGNIFSVIRHGQSLGNKFSNSPISAYKITLISNTETFSHVCRATAREIRFNWSELQNNSTNVTSWIRMFRIWREGLLQPILYRSEFFSDHWPLSQSSNPVFVMFRGGGVQVDKNILHVQMRGCIFMDCPQVGRRCIMLSSYLWYPDNPVQMM